VAIGGICDTPAVASLFQQLVARLRRRCPQPCPRHSRNSQQVVGAERSEKAHHRGHHIPLGSSAAWKLPSLVCRLAVAGSWRPLPVSTHTTVAPAWQLITVSEQSGHRAHWRARRGCLPRASAACRPPGCLVRVHGLEAPQLWSRTQTEASRIWRVICDPDRPWQCGRAAPRVGQAPSGR